MVQRNIQTREGYEVWDRLCKIPRYGFLLAPEGNRVVKALDIGDWIDRHEAQKVVDDAQSEINILKAQRAELLAAIARLTEASRPVGTIAFNIGQSHEQWDTTIRPAVSELDQARAAALDAIAKAKGGAA